MGLWIYFLFIILLCGGIVLLYYIPVYKKHRLYTNKGVNYDSLMRKFVYKVKMNRQEILSALGIRNIHDELKCTLDVVNSKIAFVDDDLGYIGPIEYIYTIDEYGGFSILRLEQVLSIHSSRTISLKINSFMVRKLNAEIVSFKMYGS